MLEKYFEYKKHKTDFKTEVIAGTTTFLTMAYIMFLNPFILSGEFAGPEKGFFDFGAVYTATILATFRRTLRRQSDEHSDRTTFYPRDDLLDPRRRASSTSNDPRRPPTTRFSTPDELRRPSKMRFSTQYNSHSHHHYNL